MALYLLDSYAVIDHLKARGEMNGLIAKLIQGNHTMCTCAVVLSEVYSGLHADDIARAAAFLDSLFFLPSTAEIGQQAGRWRYAFARLGLSLATTDTLIAATAHVYGASLVTRNVRHYPMEDITLVSPSS